MSLANIGSGLGAPPSARGCELPAQPSQPAAPPSTASPVSDAAQSTVTTISSSLGPAQSTSQPVSAPVDCIDSGGVGRKLLDGQSTSGMALEAGSQEARDDKALVPEAHRPVKPTAHARNYGNLGS